MRDKLDYLEDVLNYIEKAIEELKNIEDSLQEDVLTEYQENRVYFLRDELMHLYYEIQDYSQVVNDIEA